MNTNKDKSSTTGNSYSQQIRHSITHAFTSLVYKWYLSIVHNWENHDSSQVGSDIVEMGTIHTELYKSKYAI